MSHFIELHVSGEDGGPFLVNTSRIATVVKAEDGTAVILPNESEEFVSVTETYETLVGLLTGYYRDEDDDV